MSDEDVKQFEDINEFKYAVHPLLQYSTEAEKIVQQYEKEHHIQININGTNMNKESICKTMIRTMDKLFYMDNCSDPQLFKLYLSQHMKNIPWMNFKGTRFNVIFNNALVLLQIKIYIIQYLENTKSSLNFIQSCIKLLKIHCS